MLRPWNQPTSGHKKFTGCNLPDALQNWPKILAANSAAVAGHCAHVVRVNSSSFLLPMAPEKRKLEKTKKAAVMLRADRQRFNGTTLEKTVLLMMLQRFANLCELSRMVLFCATISRVIVGENWGPLDICNNSYFLGALVDN
jgi:hypothetical protein